MGILVRANDRLIHLAPKGKVLKAGEHLAYCEAAQVLEEAQARARDLEAAAKAAYEEERRRGYEDGHNEARLEAAEQMIEIVSHSIAYFSRVEAKVVDLVMTALRKILMDFDDRERVTLVVKNALAAMRNQKQVTLRLAPDKAEMLRERINELLAAYPAIGFLDITPDARLSGDACILESDIGSVEAGIEVQLAAIRRAFEKTLGSRHGAS